MRTTGVLALLFVLISRSPAQVPDEIIHTAIEESAAQYWNAEKIAQRSAEALAPMEAKVTTSALYGAFHSSETRLNQRPTIIKIIRKLPSFDIDLWIDRVEHEDDPFFLCYALNAAAASNKESPRFTSFLQRLLNDKRIGQKQEGEARGYASEGIRVCDWALNILWSREPESRRPLAYPLHAQYSKAKRDQMIADYANQFEVDLKGPAPPRKTSDNQEPAQSSQFPTAPDQSTTRSAEPVHTEPKHSAPMATAVVIVVGVIAAIIGLLWFLLKRGQQ